MKASECKCVVCGKQAVAWWPCVDVDIPSHPYCRECLDKEKKELLIKLFGKEEGEMWMEMDKKKTERGQMMRITVAKGLKHHWTKKHGKMVQKLPFVSLDDALEYMRQNNIPYIYTPYRCKTCGMWHLGHNNGIIKRMGGIAPKFKNRN